MTLMQRDRENLELGRKQGTLSAINIEDISSSLQLDLQYVNSVISDYENDRDMKGVLQL